MNIAKKAYGIGLILTFCLAASLKAQFNYTVLSVPNQGATEAFGISSNNIVGDFANAYGSGGFIYNISSNTYTGLPLLGGTYDTTPQAISGNNIVGFYFNGLDQAFLYNISSNTYTLLTVPGAYGAVANGISGTNIVGYIGTYSHGALGFIYNGSTYSTFNMPGASWTEFFGISGTNIAGLSDLGAFVFNGSTYTLLPLIDGIYTATPQGISGNNVVGYYNKGSQAFLYNISSGTYITLSMPGAVTSRAEGIDGNNVVGNYGATNGGWGFLATPGAPALSSPFFSKGQFQIGVTGLPNQSYSVLMTTNPLSANWVSLLVTNPPSGLFLFVDPNATNQQQFYRVEIAQ